MVQENQLARIIAPNISDPNYSSNLNTAFEAINSNFKKLATAPFLQGVKGDSYTLVDKQIWKNENGSLVTTTDGELLLKSIFGTPENLNGNTFSSWRDALPLLNGVSPIDFFIGENGKLVNNTLYFQVIINDSGEEEHESQIMGQLYYFVDARLKEIGYLFNQAKDNASVRSQLNDFTDATGFYRYEPEDESHEERYVKLDLLPTIYYDSVRNDICWKFGTIETGISAVGAPGMKGENASLNIVEVEWDGTTNNSTITAVANYTNGTLEWERDLSKFEGLLSGNNALIFLKYEGTGNISGSGSLTNTTHYHYAFGNVYKDSGSTIKAWWFSNAIIEDAVTAKAINCYLLHLGINYGADHNQFIEFPVQPLAAQTDMGTHRIGSYINVNEDNIGSLIFNKNSEEEGLNAIFSGYHEIELKTYGSTGTTAAGVRFYEPADGTPYAKYKESGFEYGTVIGGTNQYQVIGSVDRSGIVIGVTGATSETIKISPDGYTIVNPKLVIGSTTGSTERIEMSESGATFGNTVDVINNINAHSDIVLPEQGDIHFDYQEVRRIGSILSSNETKMFGDGSGDIAALRIVGDPNKTYESSSLRGSLLEIALGGTSFDYSDVGMRLREVVNTTDNNEKRITIKAVSDTSPSSVDIQTQNFLLYDYRGRKRFVVDYRDIHDTFESIIKVFEPYSNNNLVSVKNSYKVANSSLGEEKITRSRVLIDPDNNWPPTTSGAYTKNYADWNFGSDFDNKNTDEKIVGIRLQREPNDRKVIIAPCLEIQGGKDYKATAIIPFIKGDTEFQDNIIVDGRIGCGSSVTSVSGLFITRDEKIVCEGSGYFTGTINASEGYVMKYDTSINDWGFIPFSSNANIITPAPVNYVGLIAYNPNQSSLSVQMKDVGSGKVSGEIKICRSHTSTTPKSDGSGTYLSIRNEYSSTENGLNNTYIESKSEKKSDIYIRTGVNPSQNSVQNYIHILGGNNPEIRLGSDTTIEGKQLNLAGGFNVSQVDYKVTRTGGNKYGVTEQRIIFSGGRISGAPGKIGWEIDDSVPEGTIIFVTGGKGPGWQVPAIDTDKNGNYLSDGPNKYRGFPGGLYMVAKREDTGNKTLYCISSPYAEQGYLHN